MTDQPNIIFILCDQLAASFLGCYGSGVNSTPHLDELAAQGRCFTRHYAASPVCAPNRACILSGRSVIINGMIFNNLVLQSDSPTYAHVLRAHGYRTGGFGKFHQTPMMWPVPASLENLGFDEAILSEDPKWGPYIDWVSEKYPQYLDIAIAMTNEHSGKVAPNRATETMQGATEAEMDIKFTAFEKYMRRRIENSDWERMYTSPLPAEAHDTTFITEMGLDFIERQAQKEEPFFCHISYVDPHDPYDPPAPYDTMLRPGDMKDPIPAEWLTENIAFLDKTRDGYLNFRRICEDTDKIKKLRALYHGSVKFLDDQIGRVIQKVKDKGLWENTVILFSTDHGDMMGDHGLIAKGEHHYDTCIRCPLIVGGGGVKGGLSDRLTTSLDFYPTFCSLAGVPAEDIPPVEGISFVDNCFGGESNPHEEIAVTIGRASTVITADGWRLSVLNGKQPVVQMFYLAEDPMEQHNLFGKPEYMQKQTELFTRLVKVLNRPSHFPQYRNLPVRDGKAYTKDGCTGPTRLYDLAPSPWTQDVPKPEWRAEQPIK